MYVCMFVAEGVDVVCGWMDLMIVGVAVVGSRLLAVLHELHD